MGLFKRKSQVGPYDDPASPTGDAYLYDDTQNPASIRPPMRNSSHDLVPLNPTTGSGAHAPPLDYDATPIIYNRFATRWADIQLKNGLANGVASGRIWGYRGEGWLDNVVPVVPGQTRLIGGGHPGFYPAKGPAPSQWQNAYNSSAGSQPMYPGGPGYVVGGSLYNPGSGG